MINKNFDSVRAFADAIPLEFGASREPDLAWRNRILQAQPQLRMLFLTRIALWKYRARLPGFELPPPVHEALQEFDDESAKVLHNLATRLEGTGKAQQADLQRTFERFDQVVRSHSSITRGP